VNRNRGRDTWDIDPWGIEAIANEDASRGVDAGHVAILANSDLLGSSVDHVPLKTVPMEDVVSGVRRPNIVA